MGRDTGRRTEEEGEVAINLQEQIVAVQSDTQESDADVIVRKLNKAMSYVANRILATNVEILKVTDDQIVLAADAKSYDLAANVSTGELLQLEFLGVQYSSETVFTPVEFIKGNSEQFVYSDQQPVQAVHPQYCVIDNFNKVRFAPGVPSGSTLRVDYIYKPATMSLVTQTTCQLPSIFHEVIVSDAIRQCFLRLDDTRDSLYKFQAMDELYGALNVLNSRQFQQSPKTRPSTSRRQRWVG